MSYTPWNETTSLFKICRLPPKENLIFQQNWCSGNNITISYPYIYTQMSHEKKTLLLSIILVG